MVSRFLDLFVLYCRWPYRWPLEPYDNPGDL